MKCSKCGAELEEGAFFCGSCGAKVEAEEADAAERQNSGDETAASGTQEPAPEPVEDPSPEPAPVRAATSVNNILTNNDSEGEPVSLGIWLCRNLIRFIPCVGDIIYIIMLFVWSFDKKYNSTSRNWAKSELIFTAVRLAILIGVLVLIAILANVVDLEDMVENAIHNGYYYHPGYYFP